MKKAIIAGLTLVLIILLAGCTWQPPPAISGLEQYIPTKDLPGEFKYVGALNNTSVAERVLGEFNVSVVSAVKGFYTVEGAPVDSYVLVVKCASSAHANNATRNFFLLFPEFREGAPAKRFSSVSFNSHDATQILGDYPDPNAQKFIYKYVWQKDDLVFIVSGSEDRVASLKLAQLTGG